MGKKRGFGQFTRRRHRPSKRILRVYLAWNPSLCLHCKLKFGFLKIERAYETTVKEIDSVWKFMLSVMRNEMLPTQTRS